MLIADVVTVTDGLGWAHIAACLGGGMFVMLLQWVAKWLDSKGSDFVIAELRKLQAKANENSVVGQIAADDAVEGILEKCIPDVIHTLDATVQQDLADGKIDKADWIGIGQKLWATAKPQVQGGVNDYLKNSSFKDAEVLAMAVAKRFFTKQKLAQAGVIAPAAAVVTIPAK
jgi:hypothetical protein